jgi:hypothetical protein
MEEGSGILKYPPFRQEQCWKLAKPTYSWSRRPRVTRPLKKYYHNFQWGSIPKNTSHSVMKHAMCRTELGLRAACRRRAAPAQRRVGGAQTRARRRARARQPPHPGATAHHPPSPISTTRFRWGEKHFLLQTEEATILDRADWEQHHSHETSKAGTRV